MRELRVEDALLYLDQVKVEFGDRPHIYNEFLDIMKTFKTQQIDTPGVIRRVSNLFQGNRRLVLGFNTFLPEGYKIELPEGEGPPVAVYRAPGSNVTQVLRESAESQAFGLGGALNPRSQGGQGQAGLSPAQGRPAAAPQQPPAQQLPQAAASVGGGGMHSHQGHMVAQQQQGPPSLRQQSQAGGLAGPGPAGNGPRMGVQPDGGIGGFASHKGMAAALQQQQQGLPPGRNAQAAMAQQGPSSGLKPQHAAEVQVQRQSQVGGMNQPQHLPGQSTQSTPQQQHEPMVGAGSGRPGSAEGKAGGRMAAGGQNGAGRGNAASASAGKANEPASAPPAPMEFDHAINYVTTIKKRFASEPEIYKKFLEILHTYQKEQRGIKEVLDEVSTLFADHPDLLKEFTYFLPDAVQAQAKAQLDQVAKESEARKRAQAKQAIMTTAQGMQKQAQSMARAAAPRAPEPEKVSGPATIPFGATQGRTAEQETAIIRSAQYGVVSFNPVRPRRMNELTPAQAAQREGRPTSIPKLPLSPTIAEKAFFERVRDHLSRKELAADKPSLPSRVRHTPYAEFLKCLHLFGAGVLSKEELVGLLKTLFNQGHAPKSGANAGGGNYSLTIAQDATELLREFEEILVGRGHNAKQETNNKDKSKYGNLRIREFDFTNSDNPTPSYRAYPSDYPKSLFLHHSGQEEEDEPPVLNASVVCVPSASNKSKRWRSIEDYDGVRKRHNTYEEVMTRVEDERYEMDMAIECNNDALRQIEPMAQEAQAFREQEEKDGQPIGRLQYRLNQFAMNTTHISAIARIYGERGDEILQHLQQNPLIVLPIVCQRLQQKDVEWRNAKRELAKRWNAICEANYEGSMDVRCHFNRREIERSFAFSNLLDECKRAKYYCGHPDKRKKFPAMSSFLPQFRREGSRSTEVLHQPHIHLLVDMGLEEQKDTFTLLVHQLKMKQKVSAIDHERIGRIWAEFFVPWMGYPAHWVTEELRTSYGGKLTPSVVTYCAGQKVATLYGAGTILSLRAASDATAAMYRTKLPFGVAFLSPTAVLHAIPSKDVMYVRRDGLMVREDLPRLNSTAQHTAKLGHDVKLLFGTENVYILFRLYSTLCNLLAAIRRDCAQRKAQGEDGHSHSPTRHSMPAHIHLDYNSVMTALKGVQAKRIDIREFESLGRRVSPTAVHQIAALPKLVERCADSLLKTTREDLLLQLNDYCCHSSGSELVVLRARCLAVAPDAVYRIQSVRAAGSSERICFSFCYLPKSEELRTVPQNGFDESGDAMMLEHPEDGIEESPDDDVSAPPEKKRARHS